ncbi:hypothetical protein B7P43_G12673 [Cryptotermes secundus]|uniref:Reverse transcriptase domain-containing protein n=1 Tax=Cryptotermes secundus TaxID=105785 RepID=A0A2J7Q1Y9_9NEOP|nr:hypothetical protein B7P43_G12673 [Cryptotermes secundus]
MADFSAIRTFLERNNLSYFIFFPKAEKPIKAVIRHLPHNTPAEDISDGLVSLVFDDISVKQMTSRRPPPEGTDNIYLPLFLITLHRTEKSQEVFRLTNLCHIAIKVEAYRAQSGLTQCYNCQQFCHVLANCKQPPRCLWCGGGHLHKECPETGRVFSSPTVTPGVSFAAALRGSAAEQNQRPQESHVPAAPATTKKHIVPVPALQKETGQPLKVMAFNANGIGRQRYELRKQLQDLHVDVALFSETHLKPHERFFIPNYHFYRIDRQSGRKGGTAVAVRKCIPHNHVDLPPLVSVEATGVCIPIGNSEVLLAAVYKSPGRAWSDSDITELLSFRRKSILAGDLNAKNPFWNSRVSNPLGLKLVDLFDRNHLPIVFHILDHVKIRNLSEPIEKFTDWERFQSLASELISPKLEINSGVEADKAARDFAASIASAYRLSTSKVTLSDINNDLPDGPRAPTAIHGSSGLKFYPSEKANEIADCLETQFTPHDLCDKNHEERVEARVQALLEAVDENPPLRIRPCDVQKLIKSLKLKKACGIDGIPNECLRHLPRRPLVHLTHLFNHCFRLSHFPNTWKEAKIITLPKPGKDPKFPQNLRPISLLSTTGKLFEKVILKFLRKHIEERDLLNASQFGFRARHSTTLQCMRLADHVTLNFNNKMSTAAVFLDIEKAFDTTWHSGLLFKLSKLEFPNSLTKLIGSFLSKRKFRVSVEGEMSTPREMQAGVPQGSVLSPTLFNLYINDAPHTQGVHLALFADDTCLYATDRKEGFIVRKLQRGLSSMETWCERWNIKINEDKTRGVYFSRGRRPPESCLTLNGRNIPFVNSAKYLGVIFDKKVTWRLHIEMIEAKAFRTFIRVYSLFKSERLSANIKLTLHKALIRSVMTYASPAWEFAADTHLVKLQRLQNKVLRTIGNFPRRTPVRDLHMAFKIPYVYDYITKLCRQQAEVIQNHDNENVRNIGQGEARHRKYKRLKLGGGQAYDRSSD